MTEEGSTPLELILVGNGPGELTGWIAPVARAARDLLSRPARLTLVLSPSQFAGGNEHAVVTRWGIFHRILDPRDAVRLAVGRARLDVASRSVLLHLGGDLWVSGTIARRLGIPACALVETPMIARRHRPFRRVFSASRRIAAELLARSVPEGKIVVTGDPRVDAIADNQGPGGPGPESGAAVTFFPGSRDRFFRTLAPYFLKTAAALDAVRPGLRYQVVVSEFLSPGLVGTIQNMSRWRGLPVTWINSPPWARLSPEHLVVTIPGTNTVELALAGLPFVVVVPLEAMGVAAVEGPLDWVGRLPAVGPAVKRLVLQRYVARRRFVALPNQWVGRPIVPEWIGALPPSRLAQRIADLLDDPEATTRMAADLRALPERAPGAAAEVVRQAVALLEPAR